jgi:hypothetical protein
VAFFVCVGNCHGQASQPVDQEPCAPDFSWCQVCKASDLIVQSLTATNYNPTKNFQKMLAKEEPRAKL